MAERESLAKNYAGCTLNNYTETDYMTFRVAIKPLAVYYVVGKEVGENGTPHLQFMVCLKKQARYTPLKKLFETKTGHWEVMRDPSFKHASDYCKKGTLKTKFTLSFVCFYLSWFSAAGLL